MANAIAGSAFILLIASVIGVPFGIGAGVYLAEYGQNRFGDVIRFTADVLNGVVILAEGGLNDTRARQQLDPALREAYLELLKSADVSKIDRGDSKSVRLVFDITPAFLEAAHKTTPIVPDAAQSKPHVRKPPSTRKGHI